MLYCVLGGGWLFPPPKPPARVCLRFRTRAHERINHIFEEETSMETYGLEQYGITGIKEEIGRAHV